MWSFYMTANALWNQICTRGISNRYANVAFTTFAQIYSWFCTILITFALSKFGASPFFVQLDVQGLQRLIGVVTFLSKFLPQLSIVREPLRHLTDSNSRLPQHEDAFTRITSMKKEMTAIQRALLEISCIGANDRWLLKQFKDVTSASRPEQPSQKGLRWPSRFQICRGKLLLVIVLNVTAAITWS